MGKFYWSFCLYFGSQMGIESWITLGLFCNRISTRKHFLSIKPGSFWVSELSRSKGSLNERWTKNLRGNFPDPHWIRTCRPLGLHFHVVLYGSTVRVMFTIYCTKSRKWEMTAIIILTHLRMKSDLIWQLIRRHHFVPEIGWARPTKPNISCGK